MDQLYVSCDATAMIQELERFKEFVEEELFDTVSLRMDIENDAQSNIAILSGNAFSKFIRDALRDHRCMFFLSVFVSVRWMNRLQKKNIFVFCTQ